MTDVDKRTAASAILQDAPVFARDAIRCFRFVHCSFDAGNGVAQLVYAFDDGPELIETITVPGAPFALDATRHAQVEGALRLLHLLAGVSYYKAAVPREIRIDGYAIDAATAAFLTGVYENGLGEFAYRNGLSLRGRIAFPVHTQQNHPRPDPSGPTAEPSGARRDASLRLASVPPLPLEGEGEQRARNRVSSSTPAPASLPPLQGGEEDRSRAAGSRSEERPAGPEGGAGDGFHADCNARRALVAIGGGKDSLVSIELLRAAGVDATVAWIGGSQLIRACAERTGLPTLNVGRTLAPELFEYNRQGAWNGHIPVTAVNSAILALAALLGGHDDVVFSNERSASYGSLIEGSGEVNHQWSKGWDFERAFAARLRAVAPGLRYYSLLRPLSELAVARRFARLDRYDAHFSSCNRNFHLLGERPSGRWCGVCPKCHFVFLALAPFMPKPRLLAIFGRNLLDEPGLAPGFDALLEYRDHKPFECVGEARESRAAFQALARSASWREDALVARFATEIAPQLDARDTDLDALLQPEGEHGIPPDLWSRIGATLGA